MSVQSFLASSFDYFERPGVSDVQTIIDDFADRALHHNSPVWTDQGGGAYKSLVDAFGRFFDVMFTRVTQQKLEMRLRDQNGVTICTRRINCPSANTWMTRIYTGQYHLWIEAQVFTAAAEYLYAGILDLSPDAQNAHAQYVYGNGSRTTADSADQFRANNQSFMLDNNAPGTAQRNTLYQQKASTSVAIVATMNGSRIFRPVEQWVQPAGVPNVFSWAGRRYQTLIVDSAWTAGTLFQVPIDVGLSAWFKVVETYTSYAATFAIRVA